MISKRINALAMNNNVYDNEKYIDTLIDKLKEQGNLSEQEELIKIKKQASIVLEIIKDDELSLSQSDLENRIKKIINSLKV